MKRISILALGLLIGCGSVVVEEQSSATGSGGAGGESSSSSIVSSSSVVSSSSSSSTGGGMGGEGGSVLFDPKPCATAEDGIKCFDVDGTEGSCYQKICLICEDYKLGEIMYGYPKDPYACYSTTCKPDLPNYNFAHPQTDTYPEQAEVQCTMNDTFELGNCTSSGECCAVIDPSHCVNGPKYKKE